MRTGARPSYKQTQSSRWPGVATRGATAKALRDVDAPDTAETAPDAPQDAETAAPEDAAMIERDESVAERAKVAQVHMSDAGSLWREVDARAGGLGDVQGAMSAGATAPLSLDRVTPRDVDSLWDWARTDREGVLNFLGFIPEYSLSLHRWIEQFHALGTEGHAWCRAINLHGALGGFVMVYPILKTEQGAVGDCHLYLAPHVRGTVAALLPPLMAEADLELPDLSLRVLTKRDDEWARLLGAVGFKAQLVLTRPALNTRAASNGI